MVIAGASVLYRIARNVGRLAIPRANYIAVASGNVPDDCLELRWQQHIVVPEDAKDVHVVVSVLVPEHGEHVVPGSRRVQRSRLLGDDRQVAQRNIVDAMGLDRKDARVLQEARRGHDGLAPGRCETRVGLGARSNAAVRDHWDRNRLADRRDCVPIAYAFVVALGAETAVNCEHGGARGFDPRPHRAQHEEASRRTYPLASAIVSSSDGRRRILHEIGMLDAATMARTIDTMVSGCSSK